MSATIGPRRVGRPIAVQGQLAARSSTRLGQPIGHAERRVRAVGKELAGQVLKRVVECVPIELELAGRRGQVDPVEGKRAGALDQGPDLGHRLLRALAAELQVLGMKRELPIASNQSHQLGAGNLGQPLAAQLLLPEDDSLIDHLAGLRIADRLERDLESELTPQLDLDVPDVTRDD